MQYSAWTKRSGTMPEKFPGWSPNVCPRGASSPIRNVSCVCPLLRACSALQAALTRPR